MASLSKKNSVSSVGETGVLENLGRDKGQALTNSAFDQAIREDLQPGPSDCESNSGGGDRGWFSGLVIACGERIEDLDMGISQRT